MLEAEIFALAYRSNPRIARFPSKCADATFIVLASATTDVYPPTATALPSFATRTDFTIPKNLRILI